MLYMIFDAYTLLKNRFGSLSQKYTFAQNIKPYTDVLDT